MATSGSINLGLTYGVVTSYDSASSFPPQAINGTLAVALDSDFLYIYNSNTVAWEQIGSGGGGGGVSSVAIVSANGLAGTVANPTTTPTITLRTTITGLLKGNGTAISAQTVGDLTEVTSSVLTLSGNTGSILGSGTTIAVKQSSALQSGYLSSTDWSTFNSKQGAGNYITALTGDGSASGPNSATLTLATVNSNVGSFTYGSFTVNAKGLVTAASSGTAPVTSLSVASSNGFAGSSSGGSTPVVTLSTSITGLLKGNGTAISAQTVGDISSNVSTDGISITGGTGAVLGSGVTVSQQVADATHNGYLSSTDWGRFNSKQSSLTFSNSLTESTGTVTLVGDSATPGNSKYYGTDSSGVLGYHAVSGGGGGTPGGVTTNVQFNSSGSFGGNASFTYDGTDVTIANNLTVGAHVNVDEISSAAGSSRINVTSYQLTNSGATTSLDWDNGYLYDSSHNLSVNWDARSVWDSAGNMQLAWDPSGVALPQVTASQVLVLDSNHYITSVSALGVGLGGTGLSSFTKGDLLVASGATTLVKLPVGTNGQILTADSAQSSGVKWATSGSGSAISALTGDGTASGPGSSALTLATVNANVGTFSYGSFTVNGKGLITAASSGTTPLTSVSVVSANGFAGSASGGALTLSTSVTGLLLGNGTAISAQAVSNISDVGTDGIVITGGTGAILGSGVTIAQTKADATHNGYLSSTDWSTFNSAAGGGISSLTGDVTGTGPGATATTLASVNSNIGSFTYGSFTVNSKGLITAASSGAAPLTSLTGDVTTSTSGAAAATLATVNANVGSFTLSNLTVNAKGLVTAASSASTTGSGSVVLASSPTLVSPALGTPSSIVGTNLSGTGSNFTAGKAIAPNAGTARGVVTLDVSGNFQSVSPGSSGTFLMSNGADWVANAPTGFANTALSNLSSVAINTDLLSGTTNTIALGSSSNIWSNIYSTQLSVGSSQLLNILNTSVLTNLPLTTGTYNVIQGATNNLAFVTVNTSSITNSVGINIGTGHTTGTGGAGSGQINIGTGTSAGTNHSGNLQITTGANNNSTVGGVLTGNIALQTGSAAENTGAITLQTGASSGQTSGNINLTIGTGGTASGNVVLTNGAIIPSTDNNFAASLGKSTTSFSNVYAYNHVVSNGVSSNIVISSAGGSYTFGLPTSGGTAGQPLLSNGGSGSQTYATLGVAAGGTNQTTYTKGDLLVASASTTLTKLAIGSNTQVLIADSTQATGVKWGAAGSVTSVAAAGPTGIATWSAAITSAGTLTQTLSSQSANTFLSGPTSGAAATPTFRAHVAADMPAYSITGTSASPTTITASGGITPVNVRQKQIWVLRSAGGAVTITANPQIGPGTAGDEICLIGNSSVDYPIFSDGNGLSLNGPVLLTDNASISLIYNGSVWFEVGRR